MVYSDVVGTQVGKLFEGELADLPFWYEYDVDNGTVHWNHLIRHLGRADASPLPKVTQAKGYLVKEGETPCRKTVLRNMTYLDTSEADPAFLREEPDV